MLCHLMSFIFDETWVSHKDFISSLFTGFSQKYSSKSQLSRIQKYIPQKNPFHYYKNLTHFNVLIFYNSKKLAVTWRLRCYFFAALWPAWLKIWMRPPPFLFLFFDTRRRSSLIAYRSLRHLTVTHTDTHIRLNQKKEKKKRRSTLLNSTGGGDTDTRWDLFPNAHRWRCEAFAWEVRTALWICEPPPFFFF